MKYVYILQSTRDPERYYAGSTIDLTRRMQEHNDGKSTHTNKFKPWRLITYVAFEDHLMADAFESYLKTSSGRSFAKKRLGSALGITPGNQEKPVITVLEEGGIAPIVSSFRKIGWNKTESQFLEYLRQQRNGERIIFISHINELFAGYVTVVWQSNYGPFRNKNIPEIQDLNVLPQHQRMRIGTALLQKAEQEIFLEHEIAGIGVGLTPDYMPALNLYLRHGYIPDGEGVAYKNQNLRHGEQTIVGDDLTLMLLKTKS